MLYRATTPVGNNFHLYRCNASSDHVQAGCRFAGYINNPVFLSRPAIIDTNQKVIPIGEIGYPNDGTQRKKSMCGRKGLFVVAFAIGCFLAMELVTVERGFPCINFK